MKNNILVNNVNSIQIDIDKIDYESSENYRRNYDENKINELMSSISEMGLLQPIGVYKTSDDREHYKIVYGFQRYIAVKKLGHKKIQAKILSILHKDEMLLYQITENLLREDPSPEEYSKAFRQLQEDYKYTYAQIAKHLGKSVDQVKKLAQFSNIIENHKSAIMHLPDITPSHTDKLRGLNEGQVEDVLKVASNIPKITVKEMGEIAEKIRLKKMGKKEMKLPSSKEKLEERKKKHKEMEVDLIPKTDYEVYIDKIKLVEKKKNQLDSLNHKLEKTKEDIKKINESIELDEKEVIDFKKQKAEYKVKNISEGKIDYLFKSMGILIIRKTKNKIEIPVSLDFNYSKLIHPKPEIIDYLKESVLKDEKIQIGERFYFKRNGKTYYELCKLVSIRL